MFLGLLSAGKKEKSHIFRIIALNRQWQQNRDCRRKWDILRRICWKCRQRPRVSSSWIPAFVGAQQPLRDYPVPSFTFSFVSTLPLLWRDSIHLSRRELSPSPLDQPINRTINVRLSWFMQLMKLIRRPQNAVITWFTALPLHNLLESCTFYGMKSAKPQRGSNVFWRSTSWRATVTFWSSDRRPSEFGLEVSLMRI